ncbi:uncharacterized protein DDB_G0271670-like [Musca vetustissima]|uniref:uncharacterized protein DDB_G0271670-like n=1 Tax=Musca vetustissima TaxID=27455 RepID=UPI002AB7A15F|nr:uncharacterized protein DDB_G0271670-like [Musca vetustissima]
MRILRSQYLKLQSNLLRTTATTTNATNNVTTHKQHQQQNKTTCVNHNSYNLRNISRGKNDNCFKRNNDNGRTSWTTVSGYTLRQTQSRNRRINNVSRNVVVTRSISQRTTAVYRSKRNGSVSSTTSYCSRSSSFSSSASSSLPASSSSLSTSTYASISSKLSSTKSQQTTTSSSSSSSSSISQSSSSTSLPSNAPSSGYETLPRTTSQYTPDSEYIEKTLTQTKFEHLRIKFSNVPAGIGNINVNVEFTNISPQWLNGVYHSYENNFWNKIPRHVDNNAVAYSPHNKCRWYFMCKFCQKSLASFCTLKNHLNTHLELYPYMCKLCSKAYASRNSVTKHLRKLHNIPKEKYNIFIGQ